MLLQILSVVLAFSTTTFAIPASGNNPGGDVPFKSSVRGALGGPPVGWVKDESVNVDKASMMSLRIHLVWQDMDKFHELP
jgi:tripeptidyl-peptidase-1